MPAVLVNAFLLAASLVASGPVLARAAADPAPASRARDAEALAACEAAALAAAQARHPDAVEVQALEDQVSVTETAGGQTKVTGGGQYAPQVGQWTAFTYTCDFSPTTGQVTRIELP
ncbi:MAG: hypothetical protein QM699_15065 [Amaricoccus sp.]|uniref:hypothetical protein n=1 Tax=Amaricoccus sp. TaxID=1872485 RepID=UPI0039E6DA9D